MPFALRFQRDDLAYWDARYSYKGERDLTDFVRAAKEKGYLTRDQLFRICLWKSPRSAGRSKENDENFVRCVTDTAFSTRNERLRIEVLTLLCGVEWPTASTILHFCGGDRYPILDFRALWSLRTDVPKKGYDFDFWWEYTQFCRGLADEMGVTMRSLDRALWQCSKDKNIRKSS